MNLNLDDTLSKFSHAHEAINDYLNTHWYEYKQRQVRRMAELNTEANDILKEYMAKVNLILHIAKESRYDRIKRMPKPRRHFSRYSRRT